MFHLVTSDAALWQAETPSGLGRSLDLLPVLVE